MLSIIKHLQYLIFWFGIYYLSVSLAGLFTRRCRQEHPPQMRFAIIIPAHNEERVIGKLVKNLVNLHYPRHLYDLYVVADRCNDRTAAVAREEGAIVWESPHHRGGGKGQVLSYALSRLGFTRGKADNYDAAVFFDADNLVDKNFLQVMNNRLLEGEKIIQSFIDSKNPNDSWISSTFSITFWLNNRFVLLARHNLGLSCGLAGTGMCISKEVLNKIGWSTVTLTEDLEFSIQALIEGYRTRFAAETRIYDEKPLTFITSSRQRLRWARGQLNVALLYLPRLLFRGILEGDIARIEGGLRLLQLFVIAAGGLLIPITLLKPELLTFTSIYQQVQARFPLLNIALVTLPYIFPLLTLWMDRLPRRPFRYFPLYPIFTFSWVPIVIAALFTGHVRRWMPTEHTRDLDYYQLPVLNSRSSRTKSIPERQEM
ncbi:MAG: glycosyltransferase family 2 protein [Firmicutes bacterium]|nr:glycosyltransferase family 2 protein [Bacillota bacterium]